MQESLKLFKSIVNNIHFLHIPFIIFFNKDDLFAEKIKTKSICSAFPEYRGPPTYESSLQFIIKTFLSQSQTSLEARAIYHHVTTATDTEMVKKVFQCVADIILTGLLADIGLN